MDEAHKKAQATRERNKEMQAQLWGEQREATRTARKALLRVMEMEDATPAQLLEAARLLTEIGK